MQIVYNICIESQRKLLQDKYAKVLLKHCKATYILALKQGAVGAVSS